MNSFFDFKPKGFFNLFNEEPKSSIEDILREYDDSRRRSEDIEQFHRSHPDADLSDHYGWEDILDAEIDGYLDDDF